MLRNMLKRDPILLREMGDGDVTVLDMAVRHGYAELVEDVLNMFNVGGRCNHPDIHFTLEELLSKRNAEGLTVIEMAVMIGSFKVVRLLKGAIELCDEEGMVDKHVHDVKICSSLNYLTWKSMRSIHSPDRNPLSMSDDGNGQINNGACSPSSSFPTGDDAPSPTLAIDDLCSLPIPLSIRDVYPLQSERGEMEVHEIIQRVLENPIKYMEDIPKHHNYQTYRKNKKYGVLELPSFKDFREKNSSFTEEHVQNSIDHWVDECEKHPEFEFVDAKEVFIHFLCSVDSIWWGTPDVGNYSYVRFYFIAAVVRECTLQKVLTALFMMHDPQGRTPLHVAIEHWNLDIVDMLWRLMINQERREGVSDEEAIACWNARDAAGRTPLHAMVISRYDNAEYLLRVKWVDVDARVRPQHYEEWVALLHWKAPCVTLSPEYKEHEHCTAIHLAVLHNHMHVVEQLIKFPARSKWDHLNDYLRRGLFVQNQDHESFVHEGQYLSAIQLAASMGHINILNQLLIVWNFFVLSILSI